MASFLRTQYIQKLCFNAKCPSCPLKRKDIIRQYLDVMSLVHCCRFVDRFVCDLFWTAHMGTVKSAISTRLYSAQCFVHSAFISTRYFAFFMIWRTLRMHPVCQMCLIIILLKVGLRIMNNPTLLPGCGTRACVDRLVSCWCHDVLLAIPWSRSLLTTLHFEGYFMTSLLLVQATSWRFTRSAHRLTHALSISRHSANYSAERGIENARRDFVGNTACF